MTKSLSDRFAALQAERERSWAPEALERNASQRRLLVERHDPAQSPARGDVIAPFVLVDRDGAERSSAQLLVEGPLAVVFFRFGGCPACNIALPYYDETLLPELSAQGVRLIAVSAQIPVDRELIARHDLGFEVFGDPSYALARALGITFLPEEQPVVEPGQAWIGATLGTDSYEIDKPAVLVLSPQREVLFFEASPDWLRRTESEVILAALDAHPAQAATPA